MMCIRGNFREMQLLMNFISIMQQIFTHNELSMNWYVPTCYMYFYAVPYIKHFIFSGLHIDSFVLTGYMQQNVPNCLNSNLSCTEYR